MEARHLLKALKDEGWFLGGTDGAARQYVHKERPHPITVCVRYTDQLGPETVASVRAPGPARAREDPVVRVEEVPTGASAYSPDLPGCIATGENHSDAAERMAEAVALHLSGLRHR
jgi:predicted RNA binding protein YcfA (HicA-like mRNA interferase family)